MRKNLTQDIVDILKDKKPINISDDCMMYLKSRGINGILNISDLDLSSKGIYGNHIVIMNDGTFVDLEICQTQVIDFVINTNLK